MSEAKALTVVPKEETGIVRVAGNVLDAFRDYQELQRGLDKAMPDALMTIQGRTFRKKSYWRAVARAFNLSVEQVSESMIGTLTPEMAWGYSAVYRATAPNGAFADGDGTCMAKEKYSKSAGWKQATVHNVRSHAHTRAFNRAVSNLVGFGEVSAEEVEREAHVEGDDTRPTQEEAPQDEPGTSDGPPTMEHEYHGPVTVRDLTTKTGKPFWALKGNGGFEVTTFDAKHVSVARGAESVRIVWEQDGKYRKIFTIERD